MNLADRIKALVASGDIGDFANWPQVASHLGVHDRTLRSERSKMGIAGKSPRDLLGMKRQKSKPEVDVCAPIGTVASDCHDGLKESFAEKMQFANSERKWPSVEALDAETEYSDSYSWHEESYTPVEQSADNRDAHAMAPDGYHVKGVSTLYDADGLVKQRWVKTNRHSDPLADIVEAFASIKDELPHSDPVATPARCSSKQLAAYLYGDCHVGMHAWRGDAGSNFDLKIAEQNLTELTARLVDLAPPTERALIVNIGDYFHADNRGNTTTKGTPVDVDGRWAKVLAVGIRIMRRNIERALQKHQHVAVINEIGNHDTHTSIFLSLALAQFYENEPRVTIDCSSEMFHYYRFGKVLIMTHHGHNAKPADLPGIMACDRREDWGETLWRYIFTGHIHHERSREFPGANWRSLRATATADAWHYGQGYRSAQELSLEIFDEEQGLVNRHNVGVPKNLGAAA